MNILSCTVFVFVLLMTFPVMADDQGINSLGDLLPLGAGGVNVMNVHSNHNVDFTGIISLNNGGALDINKLDGTCCAASLSTLANEGVLQLGNDVSIFTDSGSLLISPSINGGAVSIINGNLGIGDRHPDFELSVAAGGGRLGYVGWEKSISISPGGALVWHGNQSSNNNSAFLAFPSTNVAGHFFMGFIKNIGPNGAIDYAFDVSGDDTAPDYGQVTFYKDVHAPNIAALEARVKTLETAMGLPHGP
jgi:hypothetical protein